VTPDAITIAFATPRAVLSAPAIRQRYQVVETILEGPEDGLYLARRLDTGALVDLRVLSGRLGADRVLVTAVAQQATLVTRVAGECPGIATVHECERTRGGLVLAMEHPEGPTLRDVIKREGALDRRRALVLAARLGEMVEAVHNLGLVHGGLRPENVVLVGAEERIVLKHLGFDWVVQCRSPDAGAQRVPHEGPVYHAPEQTWEQATHQSDIYAFGAILYEMLAGAPAMVPSRLRVYQPLESHRSDVTLGLERIVIQALEVAPERRPVDMSVVCNALTEELASGDRSPQPERTAVHGWRTRATTKILGWSAMVMLAGLALWLASPRITRDGSFSSPVPPSPTAHEAGHLAPAQSDPVTSPAPADSPAAVDRRSREARRTNLRSMSPAVPVSPPEPVQSSSDATAKRRETPNASPPQSSSEAREDAASDPGAIIDWLLNEGAGKER
jgi:serine/threonine-protein kinase